jgi:exopolysaccharide production protein ExoQ
MNPSVASLIFACGIAGLFFLARDKTVHTSPALWLPVIYLWIVGSRGPSIWLGLSPPVGTDVQLDGTPLDRMIFTSLLLVGVIVVARRGGKVLGLLRVSWPILAYFAFCLVSVTWSDFPEVSAKRWVKAIGDLVMALIIVTDKDPIGAFKRVITRVGFILLPTSVLLIKYYPAIGRTYDRFVGTQFDTGVTTDKNMLGVIVLVISLGALWRFLDLIRSKDVPNRGRLLLAWGVLIAFGIRLLAQANSATSKGCFALGAVLLVATSLPTLRRRPWVVHATVVTMLLAGGFATLLGGTGEIAHAMGRKGDLTGRTEIWSVLIPMAPNPIVGAGFESFWLGDRLYRVRLAFLGNSLNESHNGYIEVYLNLGWIGLILLGLFLIGGYQRAAAAFRRNPFVGNLFLSYIVVAAIYSITEAGFRMLDPIWIFLLLSVLASGAVSSPVATKEEPPANLAPSLMTRRLAPRMHRTELRRRAS